MAAHYRSRLEGIMPNKDFDETGEKYRTPESHPDRAGHWIAPLAIVAMAVVGAVIAIGSGLWHPFG